MIFERIHLYLLFSPVDEGLEIVDVFRNESYKLNYKIVIKYKRKASCTKCNIFSVVHFCFLLGLGLRYAVCSKELFIFVRESNIV